MLSCCEFMAPPLAAWRCSSCTAFHFVKGRGYRVVLLREQISSITVIFGLRIISIAKPSAPLHIAFHHVYNHDSSPLARPIGYFPKPSAPLSRLAFRGHSTEK